MQLGDFTELAANYRHRPGYSMQVLSLLHKEISSHGTRPTRFADVGAGTGKLTDALLSLGLSGYAVEPNDNMRQEGERLLGNPSLEWKKGSAEATSLPDACVDWVLMASSFHWARTTEALAEFHRILRPGGYFTVIYNPRDTRTEGLQKEMDDAIRKLVPELKRNSSGASAYTHDLEQKLLSTGHFTDPIFIEAPYEIAMSRERYIGVWKSVNDIQVQAGPERWNAFLNLLENTINTQTFPYP